MKTSDEWIRKDDEGNDKTDNYMGASPVYLLNRSGKICHLTLFVYMVF